MANLEKLPEDVVAGAIRSSKSEIHESMGLGMEDVMMMN
jgi:hypothetical protein